MTDIHTNEYRRFTNVSTWQKYIATSFNGDDSWKRACGYACVRSEESGRWYHFLFAVVVVIFFMISPSSSCKIEPWEFHYSHSRDEKREQAGDRNETPNNGIARHFLPSASATHAHGVRNRKIRGRPKDVDDDVDEGKDAQWHQTSQTRLQERRFGSQLWLKRKK